MHLGHEERLLLCGMCVYKKLFNHLVGVCKINPTHWLPPHRDLQAPLTPRLHPQHAALAGLEMDSVMDFNAFSPLWASSTLMRKWQQSNPIVPRAFWVPQEFWLGGEHKQGAEVKGSVTFAASAEARRSQDRTPQMEEDPKNRTSRVGPIHLWTNLEWPQFSMNLAAWH